MRSDYDVQRDQGQRLLHREPQRGLGGGGVAHLEALGLELHADQFSGFEVIFHHQRSARFHRRLDKRGGRRFRRRQRRFHRRSQWQPDREGGALAHGAFHRHRAAVQLGGEFDHGQT
jgi:hypothetical protein